MRLLHLIIFGCLFIGRITSQNSFQVMFYNTENLFDCLHDTLKNDREFLPGSVRNWNLKRYKHKIRQVAKVIVAAGEWKVPDLVGLCEVENEKVMDDLTKYSPLKEQGYRYVMTNSPDERGIDVALLYQRGSFQLIGHRSVCIRFSNQAIKPTRDILHATGLILTGDTLDVFVVHMPSRSGGEKESEPARLLTASKLKRYTDSLFQTRMRPNLIIIGDFNDYPDNRSISQVLNAKYPKNVSPEPKKLYNLLANKKGGTYKYNGEWGILDQFIVSGCLLQTYNPIYTTGEHVRICEFPFLLEEDEKDGGKRPFRTYYGFKYTGGFSDHLPVIGQFNINDN